MNDPLLHQLLDRAGEKDLALDLVGFTSGGIVATGTTMAAADFGAEQARKLADRGLGHPGQHLRRRHRGPAVSGRRVLTPTKRGRPHRL